MQGAQLRHPKSGAGAGADAATGFSYLRPSNLLLEALVRLPKLFPRAGAIAAACLLIYGSTSLMVIPDVTDDH